MGGWILAIGILMGGMGHPDYQVREQFTRELTKLNNEHDLRLVIKEYVSKTTDAEVLRRAQMVLDSYENPRPTIAAKYPKITSYNGVTNAQWEAQFFAVHHPLYCYDEEGYDLSGEKLDNEWVVDGDPEDIDAQTTALQGATFKFIQELKKSGYHRKQLVDILNKMCQNEKKGLKFSPPLPETYGPCALDCGSPLRLLKNIWRFGIPQIMPGK